ncbi:Tyrosine recombinase XerD [Limihaloglobus sulfuriphilus]|uniref:Tyrosine recombinase XerD n=1 Tax=Limihaloglobus sulfuriphilus TaxID=1851148 RepID=A0A1Q2MDI7_9BACT|nr:tyrosine-type recombinase/integrase [Limihaloglobus sulfuriphilus]AQQ70740.1 Tyrosine recombinase XerD [Limihaloglobus sulfuriphilus]
MSNSCLTLLPMRDNVTYPASQNKSAIPKQAESDEQLISLWLHGRSRHTQRAYNSDITKFCKSVDKPFQKITLGDLQSFADELIEGELSDSSVKRILSSVKSLFSFGHTIGYLTFDVGAPLKIPSTRETIAERILSQEEVQKIISSVSNTRNRLIIKTLYYTGIRVSELVSLKWKDLQHREQGGQMTILGKGGKSNVLLIPKELWFELMLLRDTVSGEGPVFRSRKGGHLNPGHVERVLKNIAVKAIGKNATPHWYRHSHASHALDNGCPIHLVQKQLNHSSIATTGRYLHARPTESSSKYLK